MASTIHYRTPGDVEILALAGRPVLGDGTGQPRDAVRRLAPAAPHAVLV